MAMGRSYAGRLSSYLARAVAAGNSEQGLVCFIFRFLRGHQDDRCKMTDGLVSMLPSSDGTDGKAIMLYQEGRAGICVVGGNAYGTVLVNTRIQ
ncbi:hypothetical protein FG476_09820 [Xylella fastidiosa subsp. multiplex]|uniref:Uncharacterized protein n=1 Tax=Xylella fastidiosa subsp. multiplex TaxID=644357 RepID=A0A9Q4MK16_XYLFS|nr:hypothetical protein Xfasm12_1042 [Xylella fastidiosa M12]AIC13685.1 hypothetical protein P303_04545 [Xylella fastidiosa MUL0034]MRT34093.1 hypothetical protein [Xylella fastidiosa subsp. multiplex]TNV88803.1 hypothetical protein C5H23_08935 [Xylella fastidiosa]MRT45480.1 hypothetical protein [Xylella fastidiosa subsp. multiplex]